MKTLKLFLAVVIMASVGTSVTAQDLPKPSPHATLMQTMGVTNISIDYSRPRVKGREIWGELVPYNEVWRVGANASTKIEFSTDVMIDGKEVKAGKYAIFMIPTVANWTVIISSYVDGWGTSGYTKESDVVRFNVPTSTHSTTENMMFTIDHVTNTSCMVSMIWEKVQLGFVVEAKTTELANVIVLQKIKEADGSFRAYNEAAIWYIENEGDKAEALKLSQKSVSQDKRFWNLTVLSEIYAANDDIKMAIKTAKEALEMSKAAEYDSYIKRNEANLAKWGK
jgi:hypothetical protein